MQLDDAIALIRSAVTGHEGTHALRSVQAWADLGAGRGTFTRALASVLAPESRIHAVDNDAGAVAELEGLARALSNVSVHKADFTMPLELPSLDGILLANALHFVKDQGPVLRRLAKLLKPNGRVVLIEYDQRQADRWLPYPIGIAALPALAKAAGLGKFTVAESRPSNYQGIIYAAYAETG